MAKSIARNLADVASPTGVLDGTLSTAAQTNITSVGTLSSLTVSGNLNATLTTAAQGNITSLGTLTALTVDNLGINGNTITANSGALNLTPASGSAIVLDGTINVDAGVVTGATSITSTAFVGGLTGNVTGNVSGTAATVTTAAQTNITSVGTLTGLTLSGALTGTTASFSTASTSDSVFTLTDTGVAAYEVTFPDTGTYQLGTNTTSNKTFKLLNSGSGAFNLDVEGSLTLLNNGINLNYTSYDNRQIGVDSNGLFLYNAADSRYDLLIDDDGNVGIGTNNPSKKLHVNMGGTLVTGQTYDAMIVQNSDAAGIRLVDAGDGGGNGGHGGIGNDNGNMNIAAAGVVSFSTALTANEALYGGGAGTGGDERMRITAAGLVGIGTTNPSNQFVIKSGTNCDIEFGSESGGNFIQTYNRSTSAYGYLRIITGGNPAETMRLAANGKVGIGTDSPDAKLHIEGNSDNSDEDCALVIEDLDTTVGSRVPALIFKGAGSTIGRIRTNDVLGIVMSGGTSMSDDLVVTNSGVGIGTTSPGSLLEIRKTTAGNITGGTSNQGATLTLHHEAQWENGYTGGDFLGALNFSSGDASTGEGVRAAIKVSVDSYYNSNKMRFYVAANNATTLVERMELDDELTFKGRSGTSPAIEMVNADSEDSDTGRETTLRFKGHRSGGELVTNAQISGHHFGTGDDDKGGLIFWANEGSAGLVQKMRMTDQYIGIGPGGGGAGSPSALLGVAGNNSNTAADAAFYVDSGGSGDWNIKTHMGAEYGINIQSSTSFSYAFYINDNAHPYTQRFRINGAGSVWRDGSTQITSDERKKKNIVDMPSQWDEFKQIRWRNFEWKDEVIKGTQFGVIAQEIQAINPNLVSVDPQTKEAIEDGIEDPKMLSVMGDMLQTKAMKALQEAMERIETLEAEVKALKGE